MFTLKMRWERRETIRSAEGDTPHEVTDEATHFVAADSVRVHAEVRGGEYEKTMEAWGRDEYTMYLSELFIRMSDGRSGSTRADDGRLIEAITDGDSTWFLASRAWLLGPNGRTIERLV